MPAKNHYAFVIDVARCIDCRACLVACSVENNVPMDHTRIWVHDQGIQGDWPNLSRVFVPYNCMHCDHPPCTEVCVSGATYKDETSGLVLVDQEACIGCGYCVEACPYAVRYINQQRGWWINAMPASNAFRSACNLPVLPPVWGSLACLVT